jgi:hypothetical protein
MDTDGVTDGAEETGGIGDYINTIQRFLLNFIVYGVM